MESLQLRLVSHCRVDVGLGVAMGNWCQRNSRLVHIEVQPADLQIQGRTGDVCAVLFVLVVVVVFKLSEYEYMEGLSDVSIHLICKYERTEWVFVLYPFYLPVWRD